LIVRISGILVSVTENHALIEVNGITYAVMITSAVGERLVATGRIGKEVDLYTMYYIEGGFGLGNLIPRLVGFLNQSDLEFFSMLITVQGLSVKRSLKALTIPVKEMARAIELKDLGKLKKLPEIGGKTAEKIVMELKGKVAKFALLREEEIPHAAAAGEPGDGYREYQREAIDILKQLQYTESEAHSLVQRITESHPHISTAEELIQEIFRKQVSDQA